MKRKHIKPIAEIAMACCTLSLLNARPSQAIILVQGGQPQATIVVEPNASKQIKEAAQTLQNYVQQSSGARLPIADKADGTSIHIGFGSAAKSAGIDAAKLDQDGFVLQGAGDRQYFIVGGSDWGTEFGVYDFLERYLGVRWLMPTELGTDVPLHNTIDVPANRVLQEPVYLSRQLSPINIDRPAEPSGAWGRFNRARGRIAFHHNLRRIFPTGETNPEFYPEVDGKRITPTNNRWQPNFSAPGIVDEAVKRLDNYFKKNPGSESYSLGVNDSAVFDESAASRARRNGKINSIGFEDVSDDYYKWVNDVVGQVRRKYPDKWFGLLAYLNVFDPPSFGLDPQVVPFIVEDRARYENPGVREKAYAITETWAQKAPSLGWYDWAYGSSYLLPRVYFHRMQDYLSWGAKHHVKFYYAEVYPNWGSGPKVWALTKLLWNPDQDVDALLDDWYMHFGGAKAAPSLKGFYGVWEEFWRGVYRDGEPTTDDTSGLYRRDPRYLANVSPAAVAQADAFMTKALQLADTPQRKARIAQLQQMWQFYKATIITYQAEYSQSQPFPTRPQNAQQAAQMLDAIEPIIAQAQMRRELLAAFKEDPLFAASADSMTLYAQTNGSNWGYGLMWRALPWAQKSSLVKARLQEMTKSAVADVRTQAGLILRAAEGETTLVTANDSFENDLKGWNIWDKGDETESVRKGIAETSAKQAVSGTHSLLLKGMENAALTKTIRCRPGNYFAKARCYVPAVPEAGVAKVELAAMAPGKTTRRVNRGDVRLPGSHLALEAGKWTSVIIPFTIPPTAETEDVEVRFLVGVGKFAPEEEIYLDEAGVYRIED